jgi:hypothetical protein
MKKKIIITLFEKTFNIYIMSECKLCDIEKGKDFFYKEFNSKTEKKCKICSDKEKNLNKIKSKQINKSIRDAELKKKPRRKKVAVLLDNIESINVNDLYDKNKIVNKKYNLTIKRKTY